MGDKEGQGTAVRTSLGSCGREGAACGEHTWSVDLDPVPGIKEVPSRPTVPGWFQPHEALAPGAMLNSALYPNAA